MTGILLFYQNPITASAYTYSADIEDDILNLAYVQWEESDEVAEVVLYVFPGDSEYEGATIKDNSITYNFEGADSFCCTDAYNNFMNQLAFQEYGVITKRLQLPKKQEYWININITSYPIRETSTYMADKNGKINGSVTFTEDYNEVFLVCGSKEWLETSGNTKLEELRQTFCTEQSADGQMENSKAANILMGSTSLDAYIEEHVTEMIQTFTEKKELEEITISFLRTEDGDAYYTSNITRQNLRDRGYDVPFGESEQTEEVIAEVPKLEEEQDTEESISIGKRVLLVFPFCILCIVFLIWKSKRKI